MISYLALWYFSRYYWIPLSHLGCVLTSWHSSNCAFAIGIGKYIKTYALLKWSNCLLILRQHSVFIVFSWLISVCPRFSRTFNSMALMHIGREKEKRFICVDVRRQDTRMYRKFDLFSSIVALIPSCSFIVSACIKILSR